MFGKTNNIIVSFFLLIIVTTIITAPFSFVYGQEGSSSDGGALFIKFLNWLFPALLSIAAILAFIMIILAGFKWIMAAGNTTAIGEAKNMITQAVIGLILAFMSYLILHTINPALVGGGLPGPISDPAAAPGTAPGGPGTGTAPSGTLTEEEARSQLEEAGIQITSTGNCNDPQNSSCTSLEGIPASTVDDLIFIKQNCGCSVTITGGTEVGHQTHGPGLPVVDLSFNDPLANYLRNNTSFLGINSICTASQDAEYRYNCNYNEPKRHLHVAF